jgi:hypothetical protein
MILLPPDTLALFSMLLGTVSKVMVKMMKWVVMVMVTVMVMVMLTVMVVGMKAPGC